MTRRKKTIIEPQVATIEALSHEGRGITTYQDKKVFVHGALVGEEVQYQVTKQHRRYLEGTTQQVLSPAADRVTPKCEHYAYCGGCSLQHMGQAQQLQFKQQTLLQQLKHFGGITPDEILKPIIGDHYGYRRKARLGVRYLEKTDEVLVGFHERNGRYLARLNSCEILHPSVGQLITPLRELIKNMAAKKSIAQIEVAIGDAQTVLMFRHLVDLTENDLATLKQFAADHNVTIYLQPNPPAKISLLAPDNASSLYYRLDHYDVTVDFEPGDFIQVNFSINQRMVQAALTLLDLKPTDKVLDLFCGLGNFSLALARKAQSVIGVEGDERMVQSAKNNALQNKLSNAQFFTANLQDPNLEASWLKAEYDKILLDPPRTGAFDIISKIVKLGASKIVYVSCNPATLARDAGELIKFGYKLSQVGIIDMFPQTAHVETIALFQRVSDL
jgi:23S rRNA (uracil1939-C5)-methyltransferase